MATLKPIVNLKRLVSKKDIRQLLEEIIKILPSPVALTDVQGQLLLGTPEVVSNPHKLPIVVQEEILGWVSGDLHLQLIATLLNHLLNCELEKKDLAYDSLEKYKEINLLYRVSGEIGSFLNLPEIGNFILQEASKAITCSTGEVLLINSEHGEFEVVAGFGDAIASRELHWRLEEGIAADVIKTGVPELVNDVAQDVRYIPRGYPVSSLICVPLMVKEKVIGAISISNREPVAYSAGDLKLVSAIAAQAAAAFDNALLHENKLRQERVRTNLGRYVASQVVDAIFESEVSLAPTKKNITILFSDIRNFTSQCEQLAPEKIVEYLNIYFTDMVEVIFDHGGTVNKFVGDMIVAIFGAPSPLVDSEQKAIHTAIEMQKRLQATSNLWIRKNFNTGIGISSGDVVVGNIGSPQHMDYTAIGDEVNVASRLQSIAKGGQILVSRSVYEINQDKFEFRVVGSINVKGKHRAIKVYEVVY